MELPDEDELLPDKYYCEQCRPRDHVELLKKLERGEKPWEEKQRQRELEEQEKKGRKGRKGKKGRKPRASEVQKEETQENGAMDTTPDTTQVEPQPAEVVQTPSEPESNKRKFPEEATPEAKSPSSAVSQIATPGIGYILSKQQEPATKTRKITTPATEKPLPPPPSRRKSAGAAANKRDSTGVILQAELVENIADLQSDDRRRVATALVKMFVDQTKQAEKQGAFSLPPGQKADAFGLRLGLAVEYAVYLNFWGQAGKPSDQYVDKFRAIQHNVKANPDLRDRLLDGSLSPNDFSKMSRDDMASKELQEKKAELMKEAEKQHMLIQEEGPRMRRTHKGEELIEDDSHLADTADPAFTAPLRKRPSEIDTNIKQGSPEAPTPQSPAAVELPESYGAGSPTTRQPLTVDTNAPPQPSAAPERKSSNNFNIQDVWSGVKGPDHEIQRSRQISRPSESAITPIPQTPGVQADAEIDQLLKDDEAEDEEPYSPVDYTAEPGAPIWHGKMSMSGIASFSGSAKHVAGADLSSSLAWHTLIPSALTIEGRIDIDRASEYLCGLRWSNTTDVVVVSVTPNQEPDNVAQFDKLFHYFTERKRYGVVGKSPVPVVKDTYVVPLEAGMSKKADFVELLEYCIIEDPTPERMLLLTFVVKASNSPSTQQTPRPLDASISSPIGNNSHGPGPSPMGQHAGFQGTPTPALPFPPPQPHLPPYAASPTQHAYMPPHQPQHQSPYPPQHHPMTGMDAARQVLGDMANSPVVSQLLAESPNTSAAEFGVIREFFNTVPATVGDYHMLKSMLSLRMQQEQQNGSAQ